MYTKNPVRGLDIPVFLKKKKPHILDDPSSINVYIEKEKGPSTEPCGTPMVS